MIKKGTKLYSIIHNKCPKCHSGEFFVHQTPFRIKGNLKLHEKCPNCDLKYMIEPSFFYGAMYVSYALTIVFSIAIFVLGYLLGFDLITRFIAIIVALILTTPITMRLSRIIYINLFISFEEEAS